MHETSWWPNQIYNWTIPDFWKCSKMFQIFREVMSLFNFLERSTVRLKINVCCSWKTVVNAHTSLQKHSAVWMLPLGGRRHLQAFLLGWR